VIYMFRFSHTYIRLQIFKKKIGRSGFEVKWVGSLSFAPICATPFTYFGKGWSLSRSNAYVCSCINR